MEPAADNDISATTAASGSDVVIEPVDEAAPRIPVDRLAAPVRFAWKTDAESRFNAMSDEFAAAVGLPATDLIGRSFKEVAQSLGLDPQGEIAGLLERRDTWSGRSVLWPVAGTDLRIPVDLAALPVYDRDRKFSGFRGFGVARAGDAIVDPEATGLTLAKIQPADDVRRRRCRRVRRAGGCGEQRYRVGARPVQGRSACSVDRAEAREAFFRQSHPPCRAPSAEWREGPVAWRARRLPRDRRSAEEGERRCRGGSGLAARRQRPDAATGAVRSHDRQPARTG